ncbi:MAG: hypothetical protein QOH62_1169 [Solirubrobacteraceae bacterium]|jgi:hypothetical protein|nr:hypothetical protein [Solirubrobacteraceae bacterium]
MPRCCPRRRLLSTAISDRVIGHPSRSMRLRYVERYGWESVYRPPVFVFHVRRFAISET